MGYLNTGLNLRLPLESEYNATRRFLIANRHMSTDELFRALRRNIGSPGNHRKWPRTIAELASMFEQKRCSDLGLKYDLPPNSIHNTPIRNCHECGKHCYHSYIYQYDWLTHCPIHGLPLVEIGSKCNDRCCDNEKDLRTNCAVCGTDISMHDILTLDRVKTSELETLSRINEALQYHNSIPKALLVNPINHPPSCISQHYSIECENYFFPTCVSILEPDYKPIFELCKVPLFKCIDREFKLIDQEFSAESIRRTNYEFLHKELNGMMVKAIQKRFSFRPSTTKYTWDYPDKKIATFKGVLNTAYTLWRTFLRNSVSHDRKPMHFAGSEYFHINHYRAMPPEPTIMEWSRSYTNLFGALGLDGLKSCSYNVPIVLSEWIYKLDSWLLFHMILQYLDCLSYILRKNRDWGEFYEALPRFANPVTWGESVYGLYMTSPQDLKVIAPYYLAAFQIEEFQLYSEQL